MYTRDDINRFLRPDKEDSINLIGGFGALIQATAAWIRDFDPDFVELASVYVDEDFPLVVDWLSLVSDPDDQGSLLILAELEKHLLKGASDAATNAV
jgi:hypothetical protein